MDTLFDINGLQFWNSREIRLRRQFEEHFAREIESALLATNPAWRFFQCETPILTPRALLNPNYTNEDIWQQETFDGSDWLLALRPETTPGSYIYAEHLQRHQIARPPYIVWQTGKSFRREQEQPSKHCRFKEFYQQEFQCIYTADTANDYQAAMLEPIRKMIGEVIGFDTRVVDSDRLPSYSLRTMDIEVDNGDKWQEICSVSVRTDLPFQAEFVNPKTQAVLKKECRVLEIAIGLDRVVYNYQQRSERV